MVPKSLFVLVLLVMISSVSGQRCYAISMEGGGTHGAYEAGVLYSITHNMNASEIIWNDISGISTGSLNSGQCAQFAYGDEVAMSEYIVQTWEMITSQDMIAPPWPGSDFHSLFYRPSLFNTEPLRQFLGTRVGTSIQRKVTFGTTDIVTGEFVDYTEAVGIENLVSAVMCSAAPPFAFPPIQFNNSWYADGACTLNLDGFEAVKRCYEMGFTDDQITLDLMFDDSLGGLPVFRVNNTGEVLKRVNDIAKYFDTFWFINQIFHSFPEIDFRFVITPSQKLPPYNGAPGPALDFNPSDMATEIAIGKNDGLNAVNEYLAAKASGKKLTQRNPLDYKPKIHYL